MPKIKETLFGTKFYNKKRCEKIMKWPLPIWYTAAVLITILYFARVLSFVPAMIAIVAIAALVVVVFFIIGLELKKPFDTEKMQADAKKDVDDVFAFIDDIMKTTTRIEKLMAWKAIKPVLHSLKELRKNTWDVERVDQMRTWLIANFIVEEKDEKN